MGACRNSCICSHILYLFALMALLKGIVKRNMALVLTVLHVHKCELQLIERLCRGQGMRIMLVCQNTLAVSSKQ